MLRIILGIIVGFIVWSILWVGSDLLFGTISPRWWGENLLAMADAVNRKKPFAPDSTILIIALIRSFICSIAAGYIAVLIAKENTKSTLILGILLLAFGIFMQWTYWDVAPLWYHIPFLVLLIPMTILGGKFAKR